MRKSGLIALFVLNLVPATLSYADPVDGSQPPASSEEGATEPSMQLPIAFAGQAKVISSIMMDLQILVDVNEESLSSSGADKHIIGLHRALIVIHKDLKRLHLMPAGPAKTLARADVLAALGDLYVPLVSLRRSLPTSEENLDIIKSIQSKIDLLRKALSPA